MCNIFAPATHKQIALAKQNVFDPCVLCCCVLLCLVVSDACPDVRCLSSQRHGNSLPVSAQFGTVPVSGTYCNVQLCRWTEGEAQQWLIGTDCWNLYCMVTGTSTAFSTAALPSICTPPWTGGDSLWAVPCGAVGAHHPPICTAPPRNVAPADATIVPAVRQDDRLRHPRAAPPHAARRARRATGSGLEDLHQLVHQRHRSIEHRHGAKVSMICSTGTLSSSSSTKYRVPGSWVVGSSGTRPCC